MGISPIPGILPLPVTKVPGAESDVSRVLDVENSSKPDDDSYSGNGKNAAGGQDDEAEEQEAAVDPAPASELPGDGQGVQVNYFA
jgi:hypothetical protein